ncbi:MAG: transcriptional repressor [Candidatus Thorarchaeota archaeon]
MTASTETMNATIFKGTSPDSLLNLFRAVLMDLTEKEMQILSAVKAQIDEFNEYPTARQIQYSLLKSDVPLRRSQLYEYLKKLNEIGFLSVNAFQHPRKYRLSETTLHYGIREMISKKKLEIRNKMHLLEKELQNLEDIDYEIKKRR